MDYATTGDVAGSTPLGADLASLQIERDRLATSAEFAQHVGQVLERLGHLWMRRSQRLLADRERPAIEGLGFRGLSLCDVQLSEIRSAQGDVGMVWTLQLFLDGQRPHQQRLGFSVLPVHAMEDAEIVQGLRYISVRLSMHGLIDLQRLQIQGLRLNMFALSGIDLRQLRQSDGNAAVFTAVRLGLLDRNLVETFGFSVVALLHRLLPSSHDRSPRLFLARQAQQEQA